MAADGYLPPLVTELKADVSGLRKGIDDAKAMVKKYKEDVDGLGENLKKTKRETEGTGKAVSDFERLVRQKMRSGESATSALRTEWERLHKVVKDSRASLARGGGSDNDHDILKNALGDISKLQGIAADIGLKFGETTSKSFATTLTGLGPFIQSFLVTAVIGAALIAAPFVGGVIGAAVTLGLGAGVIGLAAMILKDDKKIAAAWEKLTKTTSEVFQRAAAPMKKPFLELLKWLRIEFVKLEPDLTKLFEAAAPLVKPLGEGVFGLLKNMLPGITQALKNAEPVFKTLGEQLPTIGLALGIFFTELTKDPEALSGALTDAINLISGFIIVSGELISWLATTWAEIKKFFGNIHQWFKDLPGKIKAALGSPYTWLFPTGAVIIDGLIGGMNSRVSALGSAVRNAMKAGVAHAKAELKSKSPSRVFFDLGRDTVEGYRLGIQASQTQAWAAMSGMVSPGSVPAGRSAALAAQAAPVQRGPSSHAEVTGVAHIYLDGREIQQAGITYAQRDKVRNGSTGWS